MVWFRPNCIGLDIDIGHSTDPHEAWVGEGVAEWGVGGGTALEKKFTNAAEGNTIHL